MAGISSPDEILLSTTAKANFQRVVRLLISGGTTVLREIFDMRCPPCNLPKILTNPAIVKQLKAAKLTKPQWDCLFPSPGAYGKATDFDVTLLFKLLRTICSLSPPSTGWDSLPASTDHSLAADIARIKHYRNTVYAHANQSMEITDDKFPLLWQEISEALVRVAGQISTTKKMEWQKAIDNLLKDPLTAEDERNVEELLRWYKNDTEVKKSVDELKRTTQKGIERLETSLEEKVQNLEVTVRDEAQEIKAHLGEQLSATTDVIQEGMERLEANLKDVQEGLEGSTCGIETAVREEVHDIKEQLTTTTQKVHKEMKRWETGLTGATATVREETQDMKDKLDEVQQEAQEIKEQLNTLGNTTTQEVREGMERLETSLTGTTATVREETQDIKEKLDEVQQEAQEIKEQLNTIGNTTTQEVHESMERLETSLTGATATVREETQDMKDKLDEVQQEAQEIKEQLNTLGNTTTQEVREGMERLEIRLTGATATVREETQDIKDKLDEVHQSIADKLNAQVEGSQSSGARIRLRIDCETISGPGRSEGSSEVAVTSQKHEEEVQGAVAAPMVSRKQRSESSDVLEGVTLPDPQKVLSFIALKAFQPVDPSKPEQLNGFLDYMEKVRKVLIVDTHVGSLIITVECSSMEILDGLWDDYSTGHLREMAQTFLVTEDILKEFGLTEVKLMMTILEEEYRDCQEYFLQSPDGDPKNNRRDRKGQWTRKQWESKKDVSKPPYLYREQAGKDTTANQEETRNEAGTRSQSLPSQGGRGTSGKNQDQRPGARPYSKHRIQHPARQVSLDLKTLKEMDTTEVVETLNENIPRLKFFLQSQEERHTSDEFIFDLTCTLAVVCNAPKSESKNKILAALKGSLFFSAKIPCLLDRVQASTAFNDPDSQRRLFKWLIKVFTRYLRQLPSAYADLPYGQLKGALDQSNIERKDELQKELEDFKQARDEIIRAERLQRHGKRYINKAGQKPPNDFRNIPICPTNKEITTQERPFLRKNITKGRYEDAEHYLDVQFRLLREDFLEPLREGIQEIVQNVPRKQRNQLMRYYPGARLVDKTFTPSGIIYKVQFDVSRFDTRKWAHSKRLIFGSFLCLSKDNFETMLFATVANRDPEELKHGRIDIRFMKEQDVFGIDNRKCEYQMVESPAYFEAYRHVLEGLKELDESTMPFKKYLVECSEDVDPPEYLIRKDSPEPVCYDLSLALDAPDASKVPVLQPEAWPSVESLPLNNSQFEALKTAVTTEFSVIQGPPGTGKTYVGAKIVRCLLENREAWDPEGISPMLMVCNTNHALDQFLEKVLEFLPQRKIIRVAGRCKSPQLEGCNLKLFTGRHRMHERRGEIRNRVEEKVREMTAWKELLWKADRVLLEFDDLEELLNSGHAEQLYTAIFPPNAETECRNPGNTFKLWLCSNKAMESFNQSSAKVEKDNQTGKTYDGSSPQDGGEGGYDEVLYDVTPLTAPQETNEGKENDSVPPESESGGVDPSEAYSPRETLSLSDTLSEVDASNPATKKDLVEVPLDTSLPKDQVCIEGLNEVENATPIEENSCEDTSEETITIEKEADLIQYQRFIHGDEDFLPVISKQRHDLESRKEDEDKTIEELEDGWETVTYRKKGKAFPWQQKHEKNAKSGVDSAPMSNVPNQENVTQTKSSKKKEKKKDKKIKITADIKSLKPDLEKETMMTTDEAMCVDNIWLLSRSDRLRLYLFWVEGYRERYRVEIRRSEQEYEDLCLELETVRFEEEEEVIRRATVVGMTTITAARYHSVLQRVAPKIVVIEEAAEVMEAHIVTSLAKDTKHTILIGDHKHLRPKATVYELAQKYNLEISLFERMVMNSMNCKRLSIQHRMRPEIAALTKRIYDHEIVDHESVCEFADITGVTYNLFFIDHCEHEILDRGLQSYSNPHEADFLVALCSYLLLQGYERSQITILTMYTGQLLLLQEKMPRRIFGGVRVCAVDNFRGEENDIILLSLVRSNDERKIGFLSESNRICFALSRARQGFYCIGNFRLLKSQSKLWKEICDDLQTKNAIGEKLQLICKKHRNVTNVRCSSDFDRSGGCKKPCGDRLSCGHACDRLCHVSDLTHKDNKCSKTCFISCPNGHQCQLTCHYPKQCPTCYEPVLKKIPQCGHEQSIPCSTDAANFPCQVKCTKILPCGHEKQVQCFQDPTCDTKVTKTLPCGHEKKIKCSEQPKEVLCNAPCERLLPCGHPCPRKCGEECASLKCAVIVENNLACGHSFKMACSDDPQIVTCQEPCYRKLVCGHICKGLCGQNCANYPCDEVVVKTLQCGHKVTIPCSMSADSAQCPAACGKTLPCGHQCSGSCDDCHQRGSHELCQQPCGKVLVCSHRCRAVCSLPCPPCDRKCGRRCPHGKCKRLCSEPCEPCKQPCNWSCPHYQCNNLCGEECDRPRCDAPCPKKLSCHHPCIGLCGENCPTVCAVCNSNKLSSVLAGPRNKLEFPRCLQLVDCGHIITVEEMDKWMLSDLGSDVHLMRCPKCSTSITFSYRYGNVIKRTLKNVENVKTEIAELDNNVTKSVRLIGKDLEHLKYDAEQQRQGFPQRELRVEQSIPWKWNPFRRRVSSERSVLFKFTFKNHLMILQQIHTADQILQNVRRRPTSFQQPPELNELLNETKDTLERIKEYLEEPVLDLKTLSKVHEQTRKFLLFSYVLEAQSKVVMRQIPLSSTGATRISSACDQFRLFLQGDDDALEVEWLRRIVNLLRAELRLSDLPTDEAKSFMNFPGYRRGVWKLCNQGHVYFTGITVKDGEEVLVGSEGCTRCTADVQVYSNVL